MGGAVPDEGATRQRWPMIVLRTPKGWTGPKTVDGVQVETEDSTLNVTIQYTVRRTQQQQVAQFNRGGAL